MVVSTGRLGTCWVLPPLLPPYSTPYPRPLTFRNNTFPLLLLAFGDPCSSSDSIADGNSEGIRATVIGPKSGKSGMIAADFLLPSLLNADICLPTGPLASWCRS